MKWFRMVRIEVKKYFRKRHCIFEILVGFLVLNGINFLFFPEDLGFTEFSLSPYWLMVLFIPAYYGFAPGLTTGLIACLHYILYLFGGIPSQAEIERVVETQGLFLPIAFVAVGTLLGEVRQRQMDYEIESKDEVQESRESMKRMREWLESSDRARQILEARIVSQNTTLKALYESAKKLESLDLKGAYEATLAILEDHFQVQQSSIYIKEATYYVLRAARGENVQKMVEGKISVGGSLIDIVFEENRLVTVRDILRRTDSQRYLGQYGQVIAMIPLRDDRGVPIGVVNIEKMDFLAFNQPNLEMIELVVEWTSQDIRNIQYLNRTRSQLIVDEEYNIGTYSHFENVLRYEFIRAKKYDLNLTVALIKLDRYGLLPEEAQKILSNALVALLKRYLSETDQLFLYRYDGTFVVISPMRWEEDLKGVLNQVRDELKKVTDQVTFGFVKYRDGMTSPSDMLTPALEKCRLGGF